MKLLNGIKKWLHKARNRLVATVGQVALLANISEEILFESPHSALSILFGIIGITVIEGLLYLHSTEEKEK